MSARGILVTGTDTGIGKTVVGCALAAALSEDLRLHPLKPAETGCTWSGEELVPDDAVRLRAAARSDAPLATICPYRYEEPLAPWLAARRAERPIDPETVRRCYRELAASADVVLVETAGGLLVPIADGYSFADLARDLDLGVLLVVGSRLGAINPTLLSLEVARYRNLYVLGYVLNELVDEPDLATRTNAEVLATFADEHSLGTFPRLPLTGDTEWDRSILVAAGRPLAAALTEKW